MAFPHHFMFGENHGVMFPSFLKSYGGLTTNRPRAIFDVTLWGPCMWRHRSCHILQYCFQLPIYIVETLEKSCLALEHLLKLEQGNVFPLAYFHWKEIFLSFVKQYLERYDVQRNTNFMLQSNFSDNVAVIIFSEAT